MAREQIMAAGGIVLRREQPPRIAVVRLRKRDEWVLPKGKLDDGETPRDAARREVLEETGHSVTVHEFLGTLVVDTGTRAKIVHYWRMEAGGEQTRALMDDIRAVDWLPLDQAVERLSRSHEKTFLENVGPYALAGLIRRTRTKSDEAKTAAGKPAAKAPQAAAAKPATPRRRRMPAIEPAAPVAAPVAAATALPETEVAIEHVAPDMHGAEPSHTGISDVERVQAVAVEIQSMLSEAASRANQPETDASVPASADDPADRTEPPRRTLAQKVRGWFGRAA